MLNQLSEMGACRKPHRNVFTKPSLIMVEVLLSLGTNLLHQASIQSGLFNMILLNIPVINGILFLQGDVITEPPMGAEPIYLAIMVPLPGQLRTVR